MENEDDDFELNNFQFRILSQNLEEEDEEQDIINKDSFEEIENKELYNKDNPFYNKIFSETKNINLYLINSMKEFHLLFNNKSINNFEDCLKYLESIEKTNKCVCAAVIDTIPGWRCVDCSKYDNAIYCNDCYKRSKAFHKGHKVHFLPHSGGMCDCGDPDSLYTFCPQHSGPYSDQNKINEYISSVFENDL